MRRPDPVVLLCLLTLASAATGATAGEFLQATASSPSGASEKAMSTALFALRLGESQWIGGGLGPEGGPAVADSVALPPGAGVYDLEPLADGWVIGGQLPAPEGTDLLLVQESAGEARLLPVPEKGAGRLRGQTVVMVQEGRLVGAAWVEGNRERDLEVWAAAWEGSAWGEREAVSPRDVGSQLALAGAVLDDGSWLLAWSAFDGQDDESVWSLREEDGWSPPERIHEDNEVPDVTPALVAVDGGALVAWSWFDGSDYRLRTGRFDGERWTLSQPFGDKGSLYPSFLAADGAAHLVYLTVVPETWTVLEVDAAGRHGRSAVAPIFTYDRPRLVRKGEEGMVFEWLGAGEEGLVVERRMEAAWEARR